jgi:hypothetical protein
MCLVAASRQTAMAQQAPTAQSLEGVWRITKVVSAAGVADTTPQPGLVIMARGYFSVTRVLSSTARHASPPARDPAQLTDAEKIARHDEWASFGAVAGTYEMRGDTLFTHSMVAKNVRGMTLTERAAIRQINAGSFVATPLAGEPNSGRQTTYARIR